ncbi:hypothetical protein ASG22_14285 [Chryseobacterium sp. Leaf405]|uniref:hypothetical protein n=1 Tax=Chryseobacterium sp. Leaf405 TaxID=1736367 RepID=UPI0006FE3A62|nr:hypothetical protein [Chryseobacterium sp. Leaf405]KQT22914.1 hypothetical protein ASG22_14285 [Chryseobacterium sp. Leaf405]
MKKTILLTLFSISTQLFAQVGINTANPQGSFHIDGAKDNPATGVPSAVQSANDAIINNAGNMGLGTLAPTAKLEIASGTNGTSGLKLSNINNTTPATNNSAALGVDGSGNVVVQSTIPIQTRFVSFPINATVTESPTLQIGTLEFKVIPGNCSSGGALPYTTIQGRSITGAANIGIVHGQYMTSQGSGPTALHYNNASSIGTTFDNIPGVFGVDCYNDGHIQFMFFSYTDQTYYRVNFHAADGDQLGFGGQGYMFVEYQK